MLKKRSVLEQLGLQNEQDETVLFGKEMVKF